MGMAEKEYIEREAALEECDWYANEFCECEYAIMPLKGALENLPAADVRPVVLCGVCELHGHCYTEDVFAFARFAEENRFCAAGKVKTNGVKREES